MINTVSLDDEDFEIDKDLLRTSILKPIRNGEIGSLVRSLRSLEPSIKKNSTHT